MMRLSRTPRLLRQAEASECGLACVAMIANFHGHRLDMAGLRQRFCVSISGAALQDLMQLASALQLTSRALRLEPERLADIAQPAILHWDFDHFVVLARVRGKIFTILDPARGELALSHEQLSKHFTGVALEVAPARDFRLVEARAKVKLRHLWSRVRGLKRALLQTLTLSLLLQAIALFAPYYLQLAIDQVVPSADRDFLLVLALSFAALYAIRALTEWLRGWVLLSYGQHMTFQMAGNLFHHLLRLPAGFFERRHVGDILSRLESLAPIQRALTQGLVSTLIDGVMALTTGFVMLLYDWRLALLAFGFIAAYALVSLLCLPAKRRLKTDEIAARAEEHSHQIETIRAVRTIKQFGREALREHAWRNLFAAVLEKGVAVSKLDLFVQLAQTLLWGLQITLVVYFAVVFILDGEFTIGALFAFTAYRQNFVERIQDLIANLIEFGMLRLHLERLADIVHAESEPGLDAPTTIRPAGDLAVELRNASFRYGDNGPYVLRNLNLRISPGAFIAVTGPSGGGKTTLLKLLLGLLQPERGELRVDGTNVSQHGLRAWRELTGAVMQDDQLLSGSIADNISLFDPDMDMQRVQHAATLARLHADVMRMPMAYLSPSGDMGSALSGGQRQRLLLARALYRRPRVLFLDEGTAHLDTATELMIADALRSMSITRIVVAHRPALLQRADRVLIVNEGRLSEFGRAPA
jgi:ATP-binding cassette subfamily B protein RaxB